MMGRRHYYWLVTLTAFIGSIICLKTSFPHGTTPDSVTTLPLTRSILNGPSDLLCGPRSIAGAAARLGIIIDYKEFAERCNVTSRGLSMLDLYRAARNYPITAVGAELEWNQLTRLDAPAVLYLNNDHFVFVDPREHPRGVHEAVDDRL